MFSRNIVLGFLAGAVVGAVGYKLFNENRDTIEAKLRELKLPGLGDGEADAGEEASEELTLEELMAQKERLEDLIAEYNARKEG